MNFPITSWGIHDSSEHYSCPYMVDSAFVESTTYRSKDIWKILHPYWSCRDSFLVIFPKQCITTSINIYTVLSNTYNLEMIFRTWGICIGYRQILHPRLEHPQMMHGTWNNLKGGLFSLWWMFERQWLPPWWVNLLTVLVESTLPPSHNPTLIQSHQLRVFASKWFSHCQSHLGFELCFSLVLSFSYPKWTFKPSENYILFETKLLWPDLPQDIHHNML